MTSPVPLHIVSGKGGTGKTSVALALAHHYARQGARVLVCEVEQRHGLTELAAVPPLTLGVPRLLFTVGQAEVSGLSIDARPALEDYLETKFHLGAATRLLDRAGFVDFATTIAPGLRDVLLVGKVYQAARLRMKGRDQSYDVVVLDAPPTGKLHTFLTAGDALADLVRVGPIREHADSVMEFLRAPQTRIHLVAVPQELAVTETLEARADLARLAMPLGRVLVNKVRAERPPLSAADLPGVPAALLEAYESERLVALAEQSWLTTLTAGAPERPPLLLPLLPTEVDRAAVRLLAEVLGRTWEEPA